MPLHDFAIIESTQGECEQFVGADFSSDDKVEIAYALSYFGAEYIEITSPRSLTDCAHNSNLGLKSEVLIHIRCHMKDAQIALDTGIYTPDLRGTTTTADMSAALRERL